jgi:hypothetical protein
MSSYNYCGSLGPAGYASKVRGYNWEPHNIISLSHACVHVHGRFVN